MTTRLIWITLLSENVLERLETLEKTDKNFDPANYFNKLDDDQMTAIQHATQLDCLQLEWTKHRNSQQKSNKLKTDKIKQTNWKQVNPKTELWNMEIWTTVAG